jgi:hypothetical protein
MIEKGSAGGSQFDAVHTASYQLGTHLLLKCADLSTKRGLRRAESLSGSQCQASLFSDSYEIAKVP